MKIGDKIKVKIGIEDASWKEQPYYMTNKLPGKVGIIKKINTGYIDFILIKFEKEEWYLKKEWFSAIKGMELE